MIPSSFSVTWRDVVPRLVLFALLFAMGAAGGQGSGPTTAQAAASRSATIEVAINPEARVAVTLTGILPPSARCGVASAVGVRIVNQGFVTAPLESKLVGTPRAGVSLAWDSEPLRGTPEEFRILYLTLARAGMTDVTIAFRALGQTPDLGGRERVHFLARCFAGGSASKPGTLHGN